MAITKKQFRCLVTASVAASIAGVVVSFVAESSLPAPLRDYLAARWTADSKASDLLLLFVAIPVLLAGLVSIIGLYRFWRFSRPLTVTVWIISLILQAYFGPTVDSGLATSLYEVAAILTGIILGVAYLTHAKAWFTE